MKNLFDLIPSPHVSALGWTLLHSLWQATLLGTLAALGFYLLRRQSAQSRYTLGVLVLGTQILASVATYLYYLPSSIERLATSSLIPNSSAGTLMGFSQAVAPLPTLLKMQLWIATHLHELVVCWLIGVGILLMRFAGGWLYLERLRFVSQPVKNAVWHTRFGILMAKLNIGRAVDLRETARIVTPMVVGVLRPVVLVPIGLMARLSVQQVEAILAHELAHIRRHDYFVNLVQSFVEVVYFFHPVLWWLSNRIRAEREHCCDDLAMAVCDDRLSLAHALVRVAEFRHESSLVVAFAANKPLLLRRVRRVLGVAEPAGRRFAERRWSGYLPMAVVLLSLLVGVSVYAFQGDATQETRPREKKAQEKDNKVPTPAASETTATADTLIEKKGVEQPIEVPVERYLQELTLTNFPPESRNDSTKKKLADFHTKMQEYQQQMQPYHQEIQALQQQMQPLHQRIADLQLTMEKEQFEVERFQREQEKIEWKKQNIQEARQKLVEKRSTILYPKNGQTKPSQADTEKQLADVEAQIKAKEQEINGLNEQIIQSRQQTSEAEKPLEKLNAEMEKINQETEVFNRKMEVIGEKMEVLSRKIQGEAQDINKLLPPPPPVERPARARGIGKVPPPPTAPRPPKSAHALNGKGTPVPVAAPRPPVPPRKK